MPCAIRRQEQNRCCKTLAIMVFLSIMSKHQATGFLAFSKAAARPLNGLRHMVVASLFDMVDGGSSERSATSTSNASSPSSSSSSLPLILDPLVICGPSGVGKGTLIQRFQQDYPDLALQFGFTVSHTTRSPRPGEVNGVHYHFVSLSTMQNMLRENAFVESAQVHQNFYGTSWQALRDVQHQGKRCLLDIDVQGVQRLKLLQDSSSCGAAKNNGGDSDQASLPFLFVLRPKYLFIAPPSLETLQDRLRARNTETVDALQTRLANAAAEVAYGNTTGNFDAVVINDDLDEAVQNFAEKVRQLYQL